MRVFLLLFTVAVLWFSQNVYVSEAKAMLTVLYIGSFGWWLWLVARG